jgi:hypothetical protein
LLDVLRVGRLRPCVVRNTVNVRYQACLSKEG